MGLGQPCRFPAPDNSLHVLGPTECILGDRLTLIELRCTMSREWDEAESKVAGIRW